ncbi:MAG: DNA polymerase III subunit beta [Parachlamydia sp.]|jgi:DNA polymerase-3 subunit beta|nr:DNA polymerase III subunit beta [Parachlamydia sp.]
MKFTISTQELNYLIGKIQNIVPQKPTVPILSHFLIEAFNDELILTATDLTVGIRCHAEAKIVEEGAVVLPAKRFAQLARELTVANVEITRHQETTTVVAGTSRFKLKGLEKSEFPALLDLSDGSHFHIEQQTLKDLLYRTSFAVSREDTRYALTGVLMQIENGQVRFVGTDGKRLARAHHSIEQPYEMSSQSIIPLKAIEEISKSLSDQGMAKITILPDKLAIEANDTLLLTKLLMGEYPDVNRIIPEQSEIIITLHREELLTLLRQISLFTPENNHSVRFTFQEGELHLIANSSEFGEGNVCMPVNFHGPKLEIAFNPSYFIDILRHCKEETVTIGLTDPYNPGMITDGEKLDSSLSVSPLFIIMPLRLSED